MTTIASSAAALTVFSFDSHAVRTTLINGEPWFVASDVCEALGLQNVTQAMNRLDGDERSMFNIGRQGEACIINESGLYSLILGSRKPEAKRFKKWVTSEVLPSIRKTGGYQNSIEQTFFSQRWLAHMDEKGNMVFNPVPMGAFVLTPEEFVRVIAEPGAGFPRSMMVDVIKAAAGRISG